MRIIGIDADSKLFACVAIDDAGPVFQDVYHKEKGRIAEDRILPLLAEFESVVGGWLFENVDWVYIEAPVGGRNIGALRSQAYVIGAMRYILYTNDIRHSLVDSGTWKKQVIGGGKATKEEIAAFVVSKWDVGTDLQQDVYDAACIAQFGRIARR